MENIEGPYKAVIPAGKVTGPVNVRNGERVVCNAPDFATAELIASALNLWELGSEDDTMDQLTSAHQMNLALSKRVKQVQEQIATLKNRLPADGDDDYGDNLIETGQALLIKAGKGGSYDLSTFDSARIATVDVSRTREQFRGDDLVTVRASIDLRKSCIKSGEYDEKKKSGDIGSSSGAFSGLLR